MAKMRMAMKLSLVSDFALFYIDHFSLLICSPSHFARSILMITSGLICVYEPLWMGKGSWHLWTMKRKCLHASKNIAKNS
jgi:hypothetical protein